MGEYYHILEKKIRKRLKTRIEAFVSINYLVQGYQMLVTHLKGIKSLLLLASHLIFVFAANAQIESTYYIPMSESQIRTSFKVFTDAQNFGISNGLNAVISIVATDDNTIIYYDHWEDGYEWNIMNPSKNTTQIWGDNDDSNGKPPGFATDIINAGDVIGLENFVPLPRNASTIYYDGRDKISATAQLAMSRASWAPTPGPVLSGAVEILETSAWGEDFEVPIGENINADGIFDKVSLFVMAKDFLTIVSIDTDGDGNNDITRWLNQGDTYLVKDGIQAGAKITSTRPIQAHLITGDRAGRFENRWFTLFPCELWDNSYFSPVGTTVSTDPVNVFIYNPNTSAIQVQYSTLGSSGSFNVGAKSVYRFVMPIQSGAHFYTTNDLPFFALSTIDSDVQDNDAHDWGFTLVPESYLTVSATLGWGPGSGGNDNQNGSPAWVTAIEPTTVYVDYDGNPATGNNTDLNGNKYNVAYNISAYESLQIYDDNDNDQTGMFIYTLDGTLISAAWGQDPATAAPGNPFLDFGTTVPPIRKISAWKDYELTTDYNGNGLVDQGDIITFTIHIQNAGNAPIYDINLRDTLPTEVTYIANTTRINGYIIVDGSVGTAFPLDEMGYDKASLAVNETDVYSFETQVNNPPPTITTLTNRFTAVVGTPNKTLTGEVTVPVVGSTVTVEYCNLDFTDNGGSIQSTFTENEAVCITVSDNDQNTNISSTQDIKVLIINGNTGDRETVCLTETGNNTGVFRGCINSSASGGIGVEDGILNAVGGDLIDASFTDPIYGEVCTNTAIISAPTETKVLYLSTPGQGLDRVDPVAINDETTAAFSISAGGGLGGTLDEFTSISYSGNNGTQNWIGNWTEIGEPDGSIAGDVKVVSSSYCTSGNCLNLHPWSNKGASRRVDLSGATNATLNFDWNFKEPEDNVLKVQASTNGGTWSDLMTIAYSGSTTRSGSESIDISSYISSTTYIRFYFTTVYYTGTTTDMFIDDIAVNHDGTNAGSSGGNNSVTYGSDMAIWSASATPEYSLWDGSSFGTSQSAVSQAIRWRIMQGVSAPTRDEKIVVGIESGGEISGELWNGSTWDKTNMTSLAYANETYWWLADVAYEQQSGDGMMVWSGGNTYANEIRYQVWNGSTWSAAANISAYSGNEPKQMHLAANPNSDEMVLIVNATNETDYALVWDGTSWGNLVTLASSTSDDRTDINVIYEQQSGDAMVVYGNGNGNVRYRIWNGTSWSGENSISAPSGVDGYARWTTLAANPSSDHIMLGVQTSGSDGWATVWNGSSWEAASLAIPANFLATTTAPCLAVAFESNSGEGLVVVGTNDSNKSLYHSWTSGSGWSSQLTLPFVGSSGVNSMMLYSHPSSDTIMFAIQDGASDLNLMPWSGSSWGSVTELETNTGETKNQPFVFLWGGDGSSGTVTLNPSKDTWIDGDNPDLNYGLSTELKVDREATKPERTLIQFDLSSIPAGATINSASLKLTKLSGNNDINIDVHMATADWDEGTGVIGGSSGDASWNERQPGIGWGTTGGDYGPSVASLNIGANGDYNWDVTSIVQDWVNGSTNYGFMVESPDGGGNRDQIFASVEYGTISDRPELFIDFIGGSNSTSVTFSQGIPMCTNLEMPAGGGINVINYISANSGSVPANPDITATLKHNGTTFAAIDNPTYNSGTGTLTWNTTLASNYTLPAGDTVKLEINQNDSGYSFDIEYDSDTKPSRIDLPVTTVIEIEELAIYDAPYPDGDQVQSLENGETGYIRTTISDPFGPYDITGLDLNISPPSGIAINLNLDEDDVVEAAGCNKIYEYTWKTSVEQGEFSIEAIAKEGYEGITDSLTTPVEVSFRDLGTSCAVQFLDSSFNSTETYDGDEQICMEVTDIDENEDSLAIETLIITLEGTNDTETVTLTETGINTGLFQSCINSNSTVTGSSENGTLYAPAGSLISFKYIDTQDSTDICEAVASIAALTPTLQIRKTLVAPSDGTALVNDFLQFDILVTNTGNTTITNIALLDNFDHACMRYDSASIAPDMTGTGTLNWTDIGQLNIGESNVISVYFTAISSCNPAQNTVSANAIDEFSTPLSAGPVSAEVIITNPLISISKTLITPASGPFFEYDLLAFQIDITNIGNTDIITLPLVDDFSGYCLEFQSASITPDGYGSGTIVWDDLGALAVGNTISLTTQFMILNACDPAINEAEVAFAIDENGDVVPTVMDEAQLSIESPPVAIDDEDVTYPGVGVTVSVLDNDYDINDNIHPGSVTTTGVLQPTDGTITSINTMTGAITYTPDISFLGIDTYEYIVCDSTNLCDTALVTITIKANLPPNAVDDYSSTLIDVPVAIAVLNNDSDPDDGLDTASISTTGLLPPTNGGTATNTSTGVITYTPSLGYTGSDSFEYQICDVAGACDTATVYVIIRPCVETPGQNTLTGTVFQDVNGNGIYDNQDNGASGVTVSLYEDINADGLLDGGDILEGTIDSDGSGNYSFNVTPSFGGTVTYEDVPASAININSGTSCSGTPITRTITVSENLTINDIDFGFNASHAYRGDVEVTLQSPQGTIVTVLVGGVTDARFNYDLLFDDGSGGSIHNGVNDNVAAPYYDRTVSPDNALSAFNGQNAAGIWTIRICDGYPSLDDGQYFRSQLTIAGTGSSEVRYVLAIDENDLPGNATMSTNNLEVATFTNTGQSDCANDFGYVVPNSLVLNTVTTDINCEFDPIGTIDLTVSGGILPYQYSWSNGATVEDLSGLSAGIYTVTVIDNLGVFAGMNVIINAPDPMTCPEICGDGLDNDGDGLIDNADPDCCDNVTDAGIIGADEERCGSFISNNIVELVAPMDGTGTIYYQWQIFNGTWMDILGATNSSYSPGNITATTQYRRGVHREGCADWFYSNIVTKTVITNHTDAGTIAGDEVGCGTYDPTEITSSLTPSGGAGGILEYQWQYDDGSGWTDIVGASSANYNPPLITQTTQYRRRVRLSPCTTWIETNVILKTVEPVPIATISTTPTGWLCEMEDYTFEAADLGLGVTYSWNFGANASLATANGIGPHTIQFIAPYDTAAFYPEIILTVLQNGCEDRDTVNLSIHPLPTITSVMPTDPSNCNGSDGAIAVTVIGEENLCFEISLDGGTTWEANNEIAFNGLEDGSYSLHMRYCNMDCPNPYGLVVLSDPAAIVAVNDSFSLCPGANISNTVAENDSNLTNATFNVLGQPLYGGVVLELTGAFTYTATTAICGTDEFSYQVCDPSATCCATAIVYLTFEDTSIPTLVNVPENDTISCDEEIPLAPQVFAFDNCPSIGIDVTEESTKGEDGCSQYDYTITRTWTATDQCGNSTSASQIVDVQDVVAPDIFRIYTLPNGKKMVAGVMEMVGKNWKTVNLPIDFATQPIILHQVVTTNDGTPIVSQIRNSSVSQFELRIQEEENNDNLHARESVAWIAMEPGLQTTDYQLEMESLLLSDVPQGVTFSNAFTSIPTLFTSAQTTNETDPFFLRNDGLTNTGVALNIQEEASKDAELTHANEKIGFLAIEDIGNLKDKQGILMGEVGTISINNTWTTVPLNNDYHNPVIIANNRNNSSGESATVRVRNVGLNSFEVSLEEWDYLDGIHANETVPYMVIEGSIPLESPGYCDTGTDNLEVGTDFKAVDNCDISVVINYTEVAAFIGAKKVIQRTWAAEDECGNAVTYTQEITCEGVSLRMKSVLQGAMLNNRIEGLMRDDLRRKGLLPLEEPYSKMNRFLHVNAGGGEITDTALFEIEGVNAIVDWVFLELRDPNDIDNVIATKSALLQSDGDIISVEGDSILHFTDTPVGDYYIAVRHRNHLGIISLNPYTFSPTLIPLVDFTFTFTPVVGANATIEMDDLKSQWAGDLNGDGKVIYQGPNNDIFYMFLQILLDEDNKEFLTNFISNGYTPNDFNLDGTVIYQGPNNDKANLLFNTILNHPDNPQKFSNFIIHVGGN